MDNRYGVMLMQTFSDNAGRTWTLSLTYGSAKRVKGLLGDDVDLLAIEQGKPPLLTRLATDVMLLCDVIFALLKPQAEEQGVLDEQWAEAMGGEAIMAAQDALYKEIISFFQGRARADIVAAARKQKTMIDLAVKAGEERIESYDAEAKVEQIYGDWDTNSPESAE